MLGRRQMQHRKWSAGREPLLLFIHLTGPAWCGAMLPLYPPGSGSARDVMPSRRSPKGKGDKTRGCIPLTTAHLVFSRGKVDGFPCRGLRQMLVPARLGQQHMRGDGENGEEELLPSAMWALASAHASSWKRALGKGPTLSQLSHLAFCTSTQEKAVPGSRLRQCPSETKVTQKQHPSHPWDNQICFLLWLPHLLSVLCPTWVATSKQSYLQ